MTPVSRLVSRSHVEIIVLLTSISIAREVAGPLDESAGLVFTTGDGVAADGADNAGIAHGRLGGDDRVGDVVVDRLLYVSIALVVYQIMTDRVLLLLDLNLATILECPLDNVCLFAGTLDVLRLAQGRPELGEVPELDEVPHVREGRCLCNVSRCYAIHT